MLIFCLSIKAENRFPPFIAEGLIRVQQFDIAKTNASVMSSHHMVFEYSNGWWRVEVKALSGQEEGTTSDCMVIPQGVRVFRSSAGANTNSSLIQGFALPLTFPPPASANMFPVWLTLCPNPTLPIIDAKRMWRFINVGAADGLSKSLYDPKNVGDYVLSFAQPDNAFISALLTTNSGYILTEAGYADPYPPPFNKGFLDSAYELQATTNVHGRIFPLRAVFRKFAPHISGDLDTDVVIARVSEIMVTNISFPLEPGAKRIGAAPLLYAKDFRPSIFTNNQSVRYIVDHDLWRSVSDSQIRNLVGATIFETDSVKKSARSAAPRLLIIILMTMTLVIPLAGFIWKRDKIKT